MTKPGKTAKNTSITRSCLTERFVEVYLDLYKSQIVYNMKEFCAPINLSPSNFAQMRKGNLECSLANICSLIEVYNVNPNWFFLKKGEMYLCQQ